MLVKVSQRKTSSAQQATSCYSYYARRDLSLFLYGHSHAFDDLDDHQTARLLHASDDVDVVYEMSCLGNSKDLVVLAVHL